jgi:hypothetical protein
VYVWPCLTLRNCKFCHRLHICFSKDLRRQWYFLRTALNYWFLWSKRSFSTARLDGQFKYVSGSFYSLNGDTLESRRHTIPNSCPLIRYNIQKLNQYPITSARNVALNKWLKWWFIGFSRLYNSIHNRSDALSFLVITGRIASRRPLYGFHKSLFAYTVAFLQGVTLLRHLNLKMTEEKQLFVLQQDCNS